MMIGTIPEGTDTHALLAQAIEVDIGRDHLRPIRETLAFRQELAILEHRDMAVPGEVGCRFSGPGGGIQIGRDAAHRLGAAKIAPRLRLADHDIGSGEIGEDRGARHGPKGRGWGRGPDVLANLYMKDEVLHIGCPEDEIRAEGNFAPGEGDASSRL